MVKRTLPLVALWLVTVALATYQSSTYAVSGFHPRQGSGGQVSGFEFAQSAAAPSAPRPASAAAPADEAALLKQYCVTCHNQRVKTGGLALDGVDIANVGAHAETWEQVVRKVKTGMMPPSGAPRPDRSVLD